MKRLSKWFNLWVFVALLAGAAPVYAREVAQPQLLPPSDWLWWILTADASFADCSLDFRYLLRFPF